MLYMETDPEVLHHELYCLIKRLILSGLGFLTRHGATQDSVITQRAH